MSELPDRSVERRVSDAERQVAVDRLRTATGEGRLTIDEFTDRVGSALAARTAGDLVAVTADLPAPAAEASGAGLTGRRQPGRRTTIARGSRRLVNVLGSSRHEGRWHPGRRTTVIVLMGSCRLDLRGCEHEPGIDELELVTFSLFAGVEVLVPAGTVVDAGGLLVFGGRHVRGVASETPSPFPSLRIRSYGAFGGLTVRTPRPVP